ncbi:hypothetical protein ACHWQZ_G011360 [Mnemiopsis leidyi]
MKILRAYGIPDIVVQLIDKLYTGTKAKVVTADGITEVFDILAGVLQGDTLAPYLVIIVVDYIMTVAIHDVPDSGFTLKPARSKRLGAEKLADVEFADDVATVESILLYGSESWALTESLKKRIDGCYTWMLRMALIIYLKLHKTNQEVYGELPRVTMKFQERRMRLAGHVHRHTELVVNRLLLWEPTHGIRGRGKPAVTYVDNLWRDTGLADTGEIGRLMADKILWRQRINTRTLKPP